MGVGDAGVGASIGAAVAQNFIGYDLSGTYLPLQVEAYALSTSIQAMGAYTLTATSAQTIMATTVAGSVAVAGGTGVGVAASGSGVFTENEMAADVEAYHDGGATTGAGIHAASVSISASDTSQITSTAAAVSLAAALSGGVSVAISLGLSLATNQIDNDVEAYIANAVTPVLGSDIAGVTTTSGGISVASTESAVINATSAAASLAAAGSLGIGVAISGAGAEATNVILGMDNAYVSASNLYQRHQHRPGRQRHVSN